MTHRQIVVPDHCRSWWSYCCCRASAGNNDGTYPPHSLCPWLGMWAMFRAKAAKVWWLLIHSQDFRGLGKGMFASQAPPYLFPPGFLRFTWVGNVLGYQSHAEGVPWKHQEHPQLIHTTRHWIHSFGWLNIHTNLYIQNCIKKQFYI